LIEAGSAQNMVTTNEIIGFLKECLGCDDIEPESDIFAGGTTGDDFHDMIEEFSEKYSVDVSGYLWYFHADEEGFNLGGFFIAPPDERVERIPVTPSMLAKFANLGKWDIQYPEHTIPETRYDLYLSVALFPLMPLILIFILWAFNWLFGSGSSCVSG
jgi:hypothetical protein